MTRMRWLVLAGASAVYCAGAHPAWADNDFIVYSPHVVAGQSEVELYGFDFRDARPDLNTTAGYNFSIAHGVNNWWKPELYAGEFNRQPGGALYLSGYEFENTFQLTDPGEYWADLGFLASYAHVKQPGQPGIAEFGPLLEKNVGHVNQRLNLIWEKQIGGGASGQYAFRSAYSASYKLDYGHTSYAPGIEAYYRPADNARQAGPVLYGEVRTAAGSELEYSFGVLYGMNSGAPNKTLLARVEYEFF